MPFEGLFWLHVKKAAGITTRRLLQPYYVEVDRRRRPKNFIQAEPREYNDILNNYRVVLGEYQFRRCLFAKKYLYKDQWDRMFSFAFSREPINRCVSMFHYLYWPDHGMTSKLARVARRSLSERKLIVSTTYAFDAFLDNVRMARASDSIYVPLGNAFSTHTAPVWEDISGTEGNQLLTAVFRLEDLKYGINRAFEEIGVPKRIEQVTRLNTTRVKRPYVPTRAQVKIINELYARDFDVYENAKRAPA